MDNWDFMHNWSLVLPPSRPSASELNRIKSRLSSIDRSSAVAILGSTPEFRDIVYECGFKEIFVLDKNPRFYEAMTGLRVYRNAEKMIQGDWLETLPEMKDAFSVILSDLTSGNIPYVDRGRFYIFISDALMKGGIFIDKVLTHPGPNIPVEDLIEKYSLLPINLLYANHFSCEMLFCSDLLDLKCLVDSTLFYKYLEERIQNPRVRCFVEEAKKITPPGFVWWYGRKWAQLQTDYCPGLVQLDVANDEVGSPYYERLKCFTFQRRS